MRAGNDAYNNFCVDLIWKIRVKQRQGLQGRLLKLNHVITLDILLNCQWGKLSWFSEYEFMKQSYLEFTFAFGWDLFRYLIYFVQSFCFQSLK